MAIGVASSIGAGLDMRSVVSVTNQTKEIEVIQWFKYLSSPEYFPGLESFELSIFDWYHRRKKSV